MKNTNLHMSNKFSPTYRELGIKTNCPKCNYTDTRELDICPSCGYQLRNIAKNFHIWKKAMHSISHKLNKNQGG